MAILGVGNLKGGTAKTTTTIYLATCYEKMGYEVCVLDADPQQSARNWAKKGNLPFEVLEAEMNGRGLEYQVEDLKNKYPLIIIDSDNEEGVLRKIAIEADMMLVPVAPTEQDANRLVVTMEAIEAIARLRKRDGKFIKVLLTKYQKNRRLAKEFVKAFQEYPILEQKVRELESYKRNFGEKPTYLDEYEKVAKELL